MNLESQVTNLETSKKLKALFGGYAWKWVEGYEGLYAVSNTGHVASVCRSGNNRTRLLKPGTPKGKRFAYPTVSLYKENRPKTVKVHRLVAKAFCPNPKRLTIINHIDGNKSNNYWENLEWCTGSHNALHAFANNLRSNAAEKNANSKLTQREVDFIRYIKGLNTKLTTREIAHFYGMTSAAISDILTFKTWPV